jgi:hypothetical protein
MTIVLDATGHVYGGDHGSGNKVFDHGTAIVVGTLTNGILVASLSSYGTTTGVRLDGSGGAPFTMYGTRQSGTYRATELWYLLNPAAGSHVIFVESSYSMGSAVLHSWSDVSQTSPWGTFAQAAGDGTTPSVNVSSASGQVVVDCMSARDMTTTTAGQTFLANELNGPFKAAAQYAAGAASVTMSWTLDASHEWLICGGPLMPAASGAADRGSQRLLNFAALSRASRW